MFGVQVRGVRGPDGQVGVVNVRDASIWTTVVVPSECRGELHAFDCCIGSPIYCASGAMPTATKADTNLRRQNQIPFDCFAGVQFEWHVPAVAPVRFQTNRFHEPAVDYAVQPSDVGAFAASALVRFYVDALIVVDHLPSMDQISKVLMDDALQFHQIVQRLSDGEEIQLREDQCIRASIEFPGGGPKYQETVNESGRG